MNSALIPSSVNTKAFGCSQVRREGRGGYSKGEGITVKQGGRGLLSNKGEGGYSQERGEGVKVKQRGEGLQPSKGEGVSWTDH